ncbi:MAG: hypothetical protein R3F59_36400 [Myxococcota bacterium]
MLWLVAGATAQQPVSGGATPEIDAQTFRPSIDGRGLLRTDDGERHPDRWSVRILGQYVDDPLVYEDYLGDQVRLVHTVWQLDAAAGCSSARCAPASASR